jgi:hypothetical protein
MQQPFEPLVSDEPRRFCKVIDAEVQKEVGPGLIPYSQRVN